MQEHSKSCLPKVTIQWCQAWEGQPSLITGTFFSKKACGPREEGALGTGLATAASLCLSHSCRLGGSGLAPQSGVVTNSGNHWEHSGTQPESAWPVPLARHFRRVPTFLGIFSLKGLDGSPIFLPLTHAFFVLQQLHKRKNPGLYGWTEQFKT